jgi:hypothetical protein
MAGKRQSPIEMFRRKAAIETLAPRNLRSPTGDAFDAFCMAGFVRIWKGCGLKGGLSALAAELGVKPANPSLRKVFNL